MSSTSPGVVGSASLGDGERSSTRSLHPSFGIRRSSPVLQDLECGDFQMCQNNLTAGFEGFTSGFGGSRRHGELVPDHSGYDVENVGYLSRYS